MGGGLRGSRFPFASEKYSYSTGYQSKLSVNPEENKKPRVFISFHIADESQVNLLRHQAKNSDTLEFTDYSVKEPFDEKWKMQCTDRIKQSTVLVVAIGPDTYKREAVLWEINKAHELGKPVIGMRIYGDKNHKIPEPMRKHGDKILPWKLDRLQNELDKY